MTNHEINKRIKEIALNATGVDLSENEELKESGLDSLSLVTLVFSIEEAFGFSFSDDDLQPENICTLSDLVTLTGKYI